MAELYTIEELVKEWTKRHPADPICAGTVRYYLDELLLEGPGRTGRGKHYTEQHLQRISIIRLMRRNGFSVEQIADLLWDLDDEETAAIIHEQEEILALRENFLQRPRRGVGEI